ncbi:MAG TPA: HAMP domain-containing sensor histidine kinase [Polyangiales bacterium]|nr:HAMP domain-containing sensor histidine kinase [Polyangiales bacterium]
MSVASATVALISVLLANAIARRREDATLSDAAETLAVELRAGRSGPHAVAEDETHELVHAGIRVAVFDGSGRTLLGGNRELKPVASGTCRDVGSLRTCSRPAASWLAVVARDQRPLREQQRLILLASALSVLLTSVLGAVAAVSIARVVTAPLARLRRAVEQVPENDPGAVSLGAASNLVEVDALRDTLHAAFVRLGAAMTQSRRFASDAAHELRTPLATLLGELELTAEQAQLSDRQGITHAIKLTQRMSILLDRLLILARLDGLQERERLELQELVEEAIDTLPPASRLRVSIESRGEGDGAVAVEGDRALLVSSLINALENSLKFSDQQVRVLVAAEAARATISIVDLGPGIKDDEREQVFAAFYRSPTSRASTIPGHGIGLALIAHVMSLHGGSARFADCERGARLDMTLPVAPD